MEISCDYSVPRRKRLPAVVNGKQVVFFEFISPILNVGIYNLSFFVELQQRVLPAIWFVPIMDPASNFILTRLANKKSP